ncbi:MAG: DUF4082 domain-containing protein, partial [Bacteroidota bacterium]|nr:DUF4082 domain-containing protein [Bacteroidota bacterium]
MIQGTYVFQLSINGGISTSRVTVYVSATPAPAAKAGMNQEIVLPVSSTTLDGSGSTGVTTGYAWTTVSGPNTPTIVHADSAITGVTGLIQGAYVFQLSINGGESTSRLTVNVISIDTTTIFTTETPTDPVGNDGSPLEVGVTFKSNTAGYIIGVRFYKSTGNTGTHIGELYTITGTRLAQATFTGETGSGWQTVMFDTAVAIAANTPYVAAYYSDDGNYTSTNNYFTSDVINGPLTGLEDNIDLGNGLYDYTVDGPVFPTSSYESGNYWVDVLFTNATLPTAKAGNNQTIISPATSVFLDGSASTGAISSYAWTKISGPNTPTIVSPASASTTVQGLVQGTYVFQLSLNAGQSVSQVIVRADTIVSIFSNQTPPNTKQNDGGLIECGVKFKSSEAGYITGVRFYKATGNTGQHIGEFYSASGTRLARATFTGETSSGWQTVKFDTAIAIKADTTYVAAYFSGDGNYTFSDGYLDTATVNSPLTAMADGTDGLNGVYDYSLTPVFPTSSYHSGNYWVDVLFTNSLTAVAYAGADQTTLFPSALKNNGVRGTGSGSESSDPVWLSGSQISLDSADPVG